MAKKESQPKPKAKKQATIKFSGELKENQRVVIDSIPYRCVGKNKLRSLLDGKEFKVVK